MIHFRLGTINRLIAVLAVISCFFVSCKDDDFSTSSNDRLSFSTDTLTFDTLFTTVGSTTRSFMVYNKNSSPLNIGRIELSPNSMFRMNVDGFSGTSLSNVEIRSKDSLYVFVEVTLDPSDENLPILVEDSITFFTNGNAQRVKLLAYGQDVVVLHSRVLPADTTLQAGKPYLVYGSLQAENLTIEKNCSLYFHQGANLVVSGNLRITGTVEEPVVFRGDRLDNVVAENPYDQLSGLWGGIRLIGENKEHLINYAHIRNGQTGFRIQQNSSIRIENSIIHNFDSCAINATSATVYIGNSQLSNCGNNCIKMLGGSCRVEQTTIANYFQGTASNVRRSGTSVLLANYEYDVDAQKKSYPLKQADFKNVIVYGNMQNEVSLLKDDKTMDEFNYSFHDCLLRAKESDFEAENISNILWSDSIPEFVSTGYPYDFRLESTSPAIDKGDATLLINYPTDLLGNARSDGKPDLGAYEYVPEEKPTENE